MVEERAGVPPKDRAQEGITWYISCLLYTSLLVALLRDGDVHVAPGDLVVHVGGVHHKAVLGACLLYTSGRAWWRSPDGAAR